jgi:hypothetical protein
MQITVGVKIFQKDAAKSKRFKNCPLTYYLADIDL